jgi:dihydropteroate synthase
MAFLSTLSDKRFIIAHSMNTQRPVSSAHTVLATRHGRVDLTCRTAVMGVLNVTPDSFYDGGRKLKLGVALSHALAMAEAGADIIDIGGESTRPGAEPVPPEEELNRVLPLIRALRRESAIPISIDTYKSLVARRALDEGADILNDISALRFDPEMASVAATEKVPIVLMHMQGEPLSMQKAPFYRDVVAQVCEFLSARSEFARAHGIDREQIILDPGIGFGKTLEHNLALLRGLPALAALRQPLLVGASRKGFIGQILGTDPEQRLEGSLAVAVAAVLGGANIIRTHDVQETRRAVRIADALRFGVANS